MSQLGKPWALHDVRSVEAFLVRVIDRSPAVEKAGLGFHEREDLLAELLVVAWQTAGKFDADRGWRFSSFLGLVAQRGIITWLRQQRGRTRWQFASHTYERQLPKFISFDDDRNRLDETLPAGAGDLEDDWDSAFGGVLAGGDRPTAWDYHELGLEPPPRVA